MNPSTGAVTVDAESAEVSIAAFDPRGLVSYTVDPSGITTAYGYDGAARELEMSVPDPLAESGGSPGSRDSTHANLLTDYTLDGDGNVVQVEDPLANFTTYTFDAAEREVSILQPNAGDGSDSGGPLAQYSFDAAGNLQSETDPDLNTTSFTYNALGWETSETAPRPTAARRRRHMRTMVIPTWSKPLTPTARRLTIPITIAIN